MFSRTPLLLLAALCAAGISAADLTLGDAGSRLTLDERGRPLALTDLVSGVEVLLPPAADAPAWIITRRNAGELTDADYPAPAVRADGDAIRYRWEAEGLPRVEGVVEFDRSTSRFRFRPVVENTTQTELEGISFPAALNFPAEGDNYTIVVSDNHFTTRARPLASLEEFTVMYPGYMFMQLAGFKIGDSALVTYTDDIGANIKWHTFKPGPDGASHRVQQMFYLRPGESWPAAYGLVLQTLPGGDYNDMARAYGDWSRQQYWARPTLAEKTARTPLLRNIFDYGVIRAGWPPIAWGPESYSQDEEGRYHYRENNKYAEYEPYFDELIRCFSKYQELYGVKPGWWLPVWNGAYFDSPYPDYFPILPEMGDLDRFKLDAAAHDFPILYHMNIAHWPATSPTTSDKRYHAGWRGGGYGRQRWSNVDHVLVNVGKSIEVEMETVHRLKDNGGVHGVYLDVIGHAFVQDDSPENPFRMAPNPYQLAKVDAFKRVRNAMTGPVMTEGRNEIYLPYIDIAYGACGYAPADDHIPMWELVYGDCVATHPFNSQQQELRNMSLSQGGVFGLSWSWPHEDGKNLRTFTESMQQQVAGQIVGERMLRYDRPGSFRVSQWPSGVFVWNRDLEASGPVGAADLTLEASLGTVAVSQVGSDGAFLLNARGDFSAEKLAQAALDGRAVYRCDAPELLCVRVGERILIRNFSETEVVAAVSIATDFGGGAPLAGRWVKSGGDVEVRPEIADGMATYRLTLPAGDCLVNW